MKEGLMVATFAAAVPGGGALALAGGTVWLYRQLRTGEPGLDRLEFRWRVALWTPVYLGVTDAVRKGRAWMAVLHNESNGEPRNYLGDRSLEGGPSIGPGQVYRATAKALKLWTPPAGASPAEERAAYAELVTDEWRLLRWSAAVFADKLKAAKGDLREAIRRYNGSGPRAEAYRDRALEWAAARGWEL